MSMTHRSPGSSMPSSRVAKELDEAEDDKDIWSSSGSERKYARTVSIMECTHSLTLATTSVHRKGLRLTKEPSIEKKMSKSRQSDHRTKETNMMIHKEVTENKSIELYATRFFFVC